MKRFCFSHAGWTSKERRFIFMAPEDSADKKMAAQQQQINALQAELALQKKEKLDLTKQINLIQQQMDALNKTANLGRQPYYPDKNGVPAEMARTRLNQNPQYRARLESASAQRSFRGLVDFLPQYHVDESGIVNVMKTPPGAAKYGLQEGAVRKRYDKEKGLLTFVMTNGQWVYKGVESTPDQMRADTVRLNEENDARVAAKRKEEQMKTFWMRRGLDGGYVPPASQMAREYELMQYYKGLAKGDVQSDPNYNPMWTDKYKVVGQKDAPARAARARALDQKNAQDTQDFFAGNDAVRDEEVEKNKNLTTGLPKEFIEVNGRQNPDLWARLENGGVNSRGRVFMYRFNTSGQLEAWNKDEGLMLFDIAANRWIMHPRQEEAPKIPASELPRDLPWNSSEVVAVRSRMANRGSPRAVSDTPAASNRATETFAGIQKEVGETFDAIKRSVAVRRYDIARIPNQTMRVTFPGSLVGAAANVQGEILYKPREGVFADERSKALAMQAGITFLTSPNGLQNNMSSLDIYFGRPGTYSVQVKKTLYTDAGPVDTFNIMDPAQIAIERQKYNEAGALPVGKWGTIPSAASNGIGGSFMYRTGARNAAGVYIVQAYSPNAGLYQLDNATNQWSKVAGTFKQTDAEYAALFQGPQQPVAANQPVQPPVAPKQQPAEAIQPEQPSVTSPQNPAQPVAKASPQKVSVGPEKKNDVTEAQPDLSGLLPEKFDGPESAARTQQRELLSTITSDDASKETYKQSVKTHGLLMTRAEFVALVEEYAGAPQGSNVKKSLESTMVFLDGYLKEQVQAAKPGQGEPDAPERLSIDGE